MKRLLAGLLISAAMGGPVYAQGDAVCAAQARSDSGEYALCVAMQQLTAAEAARTEAYQLLLEQQGQKRTTVALFADAERAWKNFRNRQCLAEAEMAGGAGVWKRAHAVACQARMTEARVAQLRELHP